MDRGWWRIASLPSIKIAEPFLNCPGLARVHSDHRTVIGFVSAAPVRLTRGLFVVLHRARIVTLALSDADLRKKVVKAKSEEHSLGQFAVFM